MTRASSVSSLTKIALAVLIAWGLSPFSLFMGTKTAYAGTYNSVTGSSNGSNVELDITVGNVGNAWYDEANFTVTYDDGSTGSLLVKTALANNEGHVEYNWATVSGSSFTYTSKANDSYSAHIVIPQSVFGGKAFTLQSGTTTITSQQMGIGSGSSEQGSSGQGSGEQGSSGQGSPEQGSSGQGQASQDPNNSNDQGSGEGDAGQGQGSQGQDGQEQGSSGGGLTSGSGTNSGSLDPTMAGAIVVDGENDDWENVSALASNDSYIPEWKLARDTAGNVYFMFDGTASTQWDYNFQWWNLEINQNGSSQTMQIANLANQTGATVEMTNNANHNTPGPFVVEAMIPASYFTDANASLKFVGSEVKVSDVPVLSGEAAGEGDDVYKGIVVDGKFKDWNPVTKYDAWCGNSAHLNCIDQAAVVWDGDMIYLYIHESPGGSAAGAGTHGNGLYAFTTDLGHQMLVQLNNDGTVSGVEGATASHVGAQWEISIPASNLPEYLESMGFGLYTASDPVEDDLFISDITNLNGQGSGGSFGGDIVIDGSYGDWAYYPHSIIEYATAGTQSRVEDSEGALYSKDGMLYAHVYTTMPAHTDVESGGEFLAAVSVAFNNDREYKAYPQDGNFYPKFFTVDDAGNITVVNEGTHLDNGTYTFYIADTRTDFSSRNYNDLADSEVFGEMKVTVGEGKDEMEFQIDLRKVADYIGADANDFKLIESQFGRLGQQWISTAGTSSGPLVGIGLGLGTVACVLGWRKFYEKRDEKTSDDGEAAS